MNSNPMEAEDTTHQTTFLDQLKTQMAAPAQPVDDRRIEVIYIDEKDRKDVDAALLIFKNAGPRSPRAVTPPPRHLGLTECETQRRVYAYGRTSNAGSNEGGSKTRQTKGQQVTASKFNLGEIVGYFHDDGVSGATTERPDWSALEIELAAHPGSILIVEEVDRLFRTPKSATYIMQFLISNGVALYNSEGFVTEQRMMEDAAKATGAYFLLSQRSLDARRRAMQSGKFMTTAPWGYIKKSRSVITPDRDLVETVRKIFRMRANNADISTICKWLDEQGVLTPTGNVGWGWSTVNGILSNYIYIGLTVYDAKPEEGEEFEPICVPTPGTRIVDVKLFAAVQAVKPAPERVRKGNGGGAYRSVLTGKLKCSACGRTLSNRTQYGNDSVLWCNPKRRGCGSTPLVSRNRAEAMVYRAIASKIVSEGARDQYRERLDEAEIRRDAENSAARDRLDRTIAEKQDHLDRQTDKAYRLELMEEMGPAIKAANLELNQLRAQRRLIMPVDFVPSISDGLRSLQAALQVLADNAPFRCSDAKSEELIRVVGKVLSTVVFEYPEDGRIRQHTILDFNGLLASGKQGDPKLVSHVIDEYDAPLLSAPLRNRTAARQHVLEAKPGLTDAEFLTVMGAPFVGKYYRGLPHSTLRLGFDALAAIVTSSLRLADCLKALGLDSKTGFAKRLANHRNDTGGKDLADCFASLRPNATHLGSLLMGSQGRSGERSKFVDVKHPMLGHALLSPGSGRDKMTDDEWSSVMVRMKGKRQFSAKTEGETRSLLDAYFRSIRECMSLRTAGTFTDLRLAYTRITYMHRRGQFNMVCKVLLEHAGLWEAGLRSPMLEIPTRLATKADAPDGTEDAK